MKAGSTPPTSAIGNSLLGPKLPANEVRRRALQDELKQGWSTWSYNMLGVVSLPDASTLTTAICQISSQDCLLATKIEDTHAQIRVGVFATDASYWQFYVGFKDLNVSLSYSGGTGMLHAVAEPINCGNVSVNCSDYALVVLPRFAWSRAGDVDINLEDASITMSPMGLPERVIRMTAPHAQDVQVPLPSSVTSYPHMTATFSHGIKIGLLETTKSAGPPPEVQAIVAVIEKAREKEYSSYSKYGKYADVKEAVQAATMWNYIYTPSEYGPFLPVSRAWDFVKGRHDQDWSYVSQSPKTRHLLTLNTASKNCL